MTGGITLSRKIIDWEWYTDANTMRVFLHLLLSANWRSSRFCGREIKRGQCVTGRFKIAKDLKISEQSVRTALEHLKSTGEITIEATNRFSVITVVKYGVYQWEGRPDNQQDSQQATQPPTIHQPSTNQQLTTSEKDNKAIREKGNKEILSESPPNPMPVRQIADLYNEICVSFPKVASVSEARKKQIGARWKQYPDLETFRLLFTKAEASAFLKGHNDRNWSASFDWMTKDANMPKILEGQYDDKKSSGSRRGGNGSGPTTPDFSDPNRYANTDGDENPFE